MQDLQNDLRSDLVRIDVESQDYCFMDESRKPGKL